MAAEVPAMLQIRCSPVGTRQSHLTFAEERAQQRRAAAGVRISTTPDIFIAALGNLLAEPTKRFLTLPQGVMFILGER